MFDASFTESRVYIWLIRTEIKFAPQFLVLTHSILVFEIPLVL
jgi:hypothetical protein